MDEARARELLTHERQRVERSLAELEGREDDGELSHVDQHLADSGTELFDTERDSGFTARLQEELAAIERAEERLAQGTFGVSIESGEQIPDERLERVPWAERTVDEQARYDRAP